MQTPEIYNFNASVLKLVSTGEKPRSDGPGRAKTFQLSINGDVRGVIEEDTARQGRWLLRDTGHRILRDFQSKDPSGADARRRLSEVSLSFLAEGRLPLKVPRAALASRPAGAAFRQTPKPPPAVSAALLARIRESTRGRPTITLSASRA